MSDRTEGTVTEEFFLTQLLVKNSTTIHSIPIPKSNPLLENEDPLPYIIYYILPYVFVGDETFPLKSYLFIQQK